MCVYLFKISSTDDNAVGSVFALRTSDPASIPGLPYANTLPRSQPARSTLWSQLGILPECCWVWPLDPPKKSSTGDDLVAKQLPCIYIDRYNTTIKLYPHYAA